MLLLLFNIFKYLYCVFLFSVIIVLLNTSTRLKTLISQPLLPIAVARPRAGSNHKRYAKMKLGNSWGKQYKILGALTCSFSLRLLLFSTLKLPLSCLLLPLTAS
jgi:hypothetical protein